LQAFSAFEASGFELKAFKSASVFVHVAEKEILL
jgi:hypothetical protein